MSRKWEFTFASFFLPCCPILPLFVNSLTRRAPSPGRPVRWNGLKLNGVHARVFITAGENECFFDHLIEMGTLIMISRNVPTMAEPGAVHEEVIVKFATGEGRSGKDYDAIVRRVLVQIIQGWNLSA
jgi:hypothetical protein